ncbi:MAG: DEAD/DEAH box helicase, partial [Proteobacteria bacterium]|nr:DEAD/DEAH box helicase [Pseudomonadota bacterium]
MNDFKSLGLSDNLLAALESKGFSEPTPIQARTIPLLLSGTADIVGQAMTGTGKTAAFGLPIIERIVENQNYVQALVLTPTRELALQVCDEITSLRGAKRVRVLPVYGGQAYGMQLQGLKRGVDVVVGTPGRILDHLNRGTLKLDKISFFVLDEADEMCSMGFIDDIRAILENAGPDRRTLLFSATMAKDVLSIARQFMGKYELVAVKAEKNENPLTKQVFYEVNDSDRLEALCRIIDAAPEFYGLVFCRTKIDTDQVAERMVDRGYPAAPIHGDLSQAQREDILKRFRQKKTTILVATDVAARGIDVPDLTHVVNFELPQNAETYVHRTGRTGRAGKEGVAATLISPREFRKLMFMARAAGVNMNKEQLPRIEDVIYTKKAKISEELAAIVAEGGGDSYQAMARELMEDRQPDEVLAALLQYTFGDELDRESYREIKDFSKPGQGPRARISVHMGKTHGMSPRKLVDFISHRTRLKPFLIQNIKIGARKSTFTVPEHDARQALSA